MKNKIATANHLAREYGLIEGRDYIIELMTFKYVYVRDLDGRHIIVSRVDCFDNVKSQIEK